MIQPKDPDPSAETGTKKGKQSKVLKVDRKKPIQKAFYRVTEKIKLTDFPAIPTEAFRNASKDKDIPGVKNLLGTTRTGAKLLSNKAEPEEIQEVMWAGLSKEFASNNLFYNPDLEITEKRTKRWFCNSWSG